MAQIVPKRKTGFVFHELYMWHDTGNYAEYLPYGFPLQPGVHSENPETKRRLKNLLDASGVTNALKQIEPIQATREQLLRFHTDEYLEKLENLSRKRGGDFDDSPFGKGSYEIATLAVGGAIAGVDAVLLGEVDNAYALIRPAGHHAQPDSGMGFCLLGNGVIAGMHALESHGLDRIAYVDWDVHHGNSAQTAFWDRESALTISLHQEYCYPADTGNINEIGQGKGHGLNINIPLPPGSGNGAYIAAFDRIVIPALLAYKPQLIFVASGFDAGALDPLGRMLMNSSGYRKLTKMIMDAANEVCSGKLVMTHEGGYSAATVPFYGLAVIEQLAGIESGVVDPYHDIMAGMGGEELLPAQEEAIKRTQEKVILLR